MTYKSKGSISIPPEIITEILLRLPAKSLGQFRCVSKDWLSLLSNPRFIKTHLKTINQNHIIFTDCQLLHSHPFNHHESLLTPTKLHLDLFSLKFCGSCDGLVLVSSFQNSGTLLVLNPTTREFVELPEYGYKTNLENVLIYTIEGFGYDSMTDDYKVVILHYVFNNKDFRDTSVLVDVYSIRTNTWTRLYGSVYDRYYYKNDIGVFVNGFIHWIAMSKSSGLHVIVAFNLADEKSIELLSPNLSNDVNILSKEDCRLFVFGGKLGIFVEGVVWLMNEYGETKSWTKIILHGFDQIPVFKRRIKPMVFDDNGKVVVANIDQLLIYDTEIRNFNSKTLYAWNPKKFMATGTYMESLVSPKFRI